MARPRKEIQPGDQFDRLTVLAWSEGHGHDATWFAVCQCGNFKLANAHRMLVGHLRSCGCLKRETAREVGRRHVHLAHAAAAKYHAPAEASAKWKDFPAEHRIWGAMKSRCTNPSVAAFRHYGGRGITVCGRWMRSFDAFVEDMGPRPSAEYSLDRVDNNGPYSPENCRWATPEEQASNRRNTLWVEYDGERRTVNEWARACGVSAAKMRYRIAAGHTPAQILGFEPVARPKDRRGEMLTFNGETHNVGAWAARLGISAQALYYRIAAGWPLERALSAGKGSPRGPRGPYGPRKTKSAPTSALPLAEAEG